jgi:hypothetical protein
MPTRLWSRVCLVLSAPILAAGPRPQPRSAKGRAVVFAATAVLVLAFPAAGSGVTTRGPLAAANGRVNANEFVAFADHHKFAVAVTFTTNADGSRNILAYVCNGRGIGELFRGPVSGDTFDLVSKSGKAHLQGTISGDGVAGTFARSGVSFSYQVVPAEKYGGLFVFHYPSLQKITAISEGGTKFRGHIAGYPDHCRLVGTLTRADGTKLHLDKHLGGRHTHHPLGTYRVIFTNHTGDGRGKQIKQTSGGSIDFPVLIQPF